MTENVFGGIVSDEPVPARSVAWLYEGSQSEISWRISAVTGTLEM